MSVLVPGATGNVGPHVITALTPLGVDRPRVVVRDAARAEGETPLLTGPDSVSYRQIADLVSERSPRPAPVVDITHNDVRAAPIGCGMAEWGADHFREMFQLFRDDRSEFVTSTIQDITGHPVRSVETFLDEQPAPFAQAQA